LVLLSGCGVAVQGLLLPLLLLLLLLLQRPWLFGGSRTR
jgi:hypothetical protein